MPENPDTDTRSDDKLQPSQASSGAGSEGIHPQKDFSLTGIREKQKKMSPTEKHSNPLFAIRSFMKG